MTDKKYNVGDLVFIPKKVDSVWTGFGLITEFFSNGLALVDMLTGTMKNKDGGFKLNEVLPAYLVPVTKETIFPGDTVRLIRKAKSYENGWENTWVDKMNKAVGKFGTVLDFSERNTLRHDVEVNFPSVGDTYGYPDFTLEKLTTQAPLSSEATSKTVSKSLLKEARAIALELATKNEYVNADQVQSALTARGLGRLGNAAGSLFYGKKWTNTGRTVPSTQPTAHKRRIIVWRYVG